MSNNNKKNTITLTQLECNRCNYKWYPRVNREGKAVIPQVCANTKCKSPYWNKERVLNLRSSKNKK